MPDRSLPLVAVNLWYHVGSRHEAPGRTGLAHLFEHMLFEGSANVPGNDHFRHIQEVGGSANGSTWYDRTNYYETLPQSFLDLALWLESDRMGFLLPALTAEKLEIQQQVVLNERRQRIDNQPYGAALERLFARLYPDAHPYGWPVIGTTEDIAAAGLADVQEFFRTWYTPDNAVLTIAGDVEPETVRRQVDLWFGELPGGPERPGRPAPECAPQTGDEAVADRVELERCYLGFRIPAYGTPAWYAADLLATELTAGKASRLYRDLVHERRIAQQVSASVLPTELSGTFLVVATAAADGGAAALVEGIQTHLDSVARGELSEDALERARNQVVSSYLEALQTLEHRADMVAQFTTFLDRPEALHDELSAYLNVRREDMAEIAERWLGPQDAVIVRVLPEDRS